MIFDRTKFDVDDSLRIIKEKIQKDISLTDEDIQILERGPLTINTLNRIDDTQRRLKEQINEMGYWNNSIENENWIDGDYFLQADLKRITENTAILKKSFFAKYGTPRNPLPKYHYEEMNIIEKILFDLIEASDYVKSNYKQCGTFQCGEVN